METIIESFTSIEKNKKNLVIYTSLITKGNRYNTIVYDKNCWL